MAHVQVRCPSEVLIPDHIATDLELPTFTFHLTDVLPLLTIRVRRLRHVHLIDHAVDLTAIIVKLTIQTITEEGVIHTDIPFLLLFPS